MAYLDQSGLEALWAKIKNWTNSVHAHSMTKGASSQDGLQLMLKNGAQTPVTLATVTITKGDITALGIPGSDTTYTPATQSTNGLMSAADKKKLDGVADGANKYVHPTSAAGAKSAGLYKVATDAQGHVTGATAVTKADITALGIPGSDTKYTHPAGNAASKTEGLYKFSTDSTSHVASATPVTKDDISPLESDPTVPAWAKAASKPSYNSSEIAYSGGVAGETVTDRLGGLNNQIRVHDDEFKDLKLLINTKAKINSPDFTGTPTAPTAAAGTNTTQIATCAFVQSAVAAASTGAAKYKGGMTAAAYGKLTTYKAGWYWVVTEAGTIAGESCEVGDMVFCNTDSTTGAKSDAHFDIVQNNIEAIPLSVINALS